MVSDTGRNVARGSRGKLVGRIALVSVLALILIAGLVFGAPKYLSLDELRVERGVLLAFVHAHPLESLLLYLVIYCLVVAVSFPGALVMTLTGASCSAGWRAERRRWRGCRPAPSLCSSWRARRWAMACAIRLGGEPQRDLMDRMEK